LLPGTRVITFYGLEVAAGNNSLVRNREFPQGRVDCDLKGHGGFTAGRQFTQIHLYRLVSGLVTFLTVSWVFVPLPYCSGFFWLLLARRHPQYWTEQYSLTAQFLSLLISRHDSFLHQIGKAALLELGNRFRRRSTRGGDHTAQFLGSFA
jgi:hypothetical protein